MKAGESERRDCDDCGYEFEVCYEPKAKGKPKEAKGIPDSKPILCCPFCGNQVESGD